MCADKTGTRSNFVGLYVFIAQISVCKYDNKTSQKAMRDVVLTHSSQGNRATTKTSWPVSCGPHLTLINCLVIQLDVVYFKRVFTCTKYAALLLASLLRNTINIFRNTL